MGDFAWVETQGLLHRADGAAVVDGDTGWRWLRHDDRHRLDGPAIVYEPDEHGWWLEGRKVTAHDVVAAWLAMHHPGTSPQVLETLATDCTGWAKRSTRWPSSTSLSLPRSPDMASRVRHRPVHG